MENLEENNKKELFSTDENYFSDLEERVLAKITGKAFHLPIGIEHPFIAPDGYFEMFESQFTQKLGVKASPPLFKIWKKYQLPVRLAAGVVMVSVFGMIYYLQNSNPNSSSVLKGVDSATLVAYLETEELDIADFSMAYDNPMDVPSDFGTNLLEINTLQDEELQELFGL